MNTDNETPTREIHDAIRDLVVEHFMQTGVVVDCVRFDWVETMGGGASCANVSVEGHKR